MYNVFSTSGMFSISRGYHEYIGGCSVHQGFQNKSKAFINLLPYMNHRYHPDVFMVSLQCTEHPPMYS